MNRSYLKNLYLQRLEYEQYLCVFEESISKVVSSEIINEVVAKAIEDTDELVLNELLALFLSHLETNALFHEEFSRSDFHLLLFRRPLTLHSYTKLRCIYERVGSRKIPQDSEHVRLFRDNFYNYCLYKHEYGDYRFDLEVDVGSFGPMEMDLFKELVRKICARNRGNEELIRYVRGLSIDTEVFLAMADPEYKVDGAKISGDDVFLVYPGQIKNYTPELFVKPFLCSLNSEGNSCRVCGREVLEWEFDSVDAEEYLRSLGGNVGELCYGISHWDVTRTPRTLTTLLKFVFQASSWVDYCRYVRYFAIEEGDEMEEIIVKLLKYVSNTWTVESIRASIRIFPFVRHTPRIVFSYFVILFDSFTRYSSSDRFMRDVVKNIVARNKDKFVETREMIFEHYLEDPGQKSSDLETLFLPLAEFFDEDPKTFVEGNMFYIYPLVYSRPSLSHHLSPGFVQKNNHFLMIALFLNGEAEKIDDMGYTRKELEMMGVDIIVPLFCNGYFEYSTLTRFFGDVRRYIRLNISKFLFTLKNIYTKRPFKLKTCVFKVLKHVLETVSSDAKMLFNHVFPFIEFFMGRYNRQCTTDCKSIFIEYYMSLFEEGSFARNMSRMLPYLSVARMVRWSGVSGEMGYMDVIESLLETRGYLSQEMAVEKAGELFRRMFSRAEERDDVNRNGGMVGCVDKGGEGDGQEAVENEFDEEGFIRSLLNKFFGDIGFRLRVINVYRKFQRVSSEILPLIGYLSSGPDTSSLCSTSDIPATGCSTGSIARTMVCEYLLEVDPKKQDLYFFVTQETLRFVEGPLDEKIECVAEQFRATQYFYDHRPDCTERKFYERTYRFQDFLERLYQHSLAQVLDLGMKEHFDLLKYGNLLDTQFLEFHCLCLVKLILDREERHEILDVAGEIVSDMQRGIDRRILRFILKLHRFTGKKYMDKQDIVKISLFTGDYYGGIQALETMIRASRERKLFDVLQYCYYMVKDYDRVVGINLIFTRPTSVNLFFEFCVDKNYVAAKRCLECRKVRECSDRIIHSTCTQAINGAECVGSTEDEGSEDVSDHPIPGLDLNGLLEGVVGKCEDDEIVRFMNDCKKIAKDFGEWKRLSSRNEVFRHFLKDCELVSKSRDLPITLDLIAGRREMAGNNRMLLECHEYLVAGIRNMMQSGEAIVCRKAEGSLFMDRWGSETMGSSRQQAKNRGHSDELTSTETGLRGRRVERIEYSDERMPGTIGRYSSLEEFERDLKLTMIRSYRKDNDFNRCIKEIGGMLLKKEWSVLYELGELNILQGKIGNAKNAFKKVLNLFPKTSVFYKKALIRYTELVDTKAAYQSAMGSLASSSRFFLLAAKKFEGTEPIVSMELYMKSVTNSSRYLEEAVPRIFHLFSEMVSPKDITTSSSLLSSFLEANLSVLPPYYNQIICKLSHPNPEIAGGISNAMFELMEHYPSETFWRSLIIMNSQTGDTVRRAEAVVSRLSFDNKVFLSNVRKVAEKLTEISKSKKSELSMSRDFPEFVSLLPINVNIPNTRVMINGVGDEIKVFHSLQCPKRISFVGTDGKRYHWLCKHKDDLRKDSRFMDLNLIINNTFKKQGSRKYIRTYTVIPFTHTSGIIEWIDGLSSLKAICTSYYGREKISISDVSKRFLSRRKIGPAAWAEVVSMFPPRLHLWFDDGFPQAFDWFTARNNYTVTCAVMNIVGWFMGLGDRHAENILFDSNSGDTVHVDLNCIFGKGRELEIAERVPYRLTQNMVDAFGVLGLEGLYNKSLYATMELFLKNKNVVISNLLSFVYDPLLEWRKKADMPKKIINELYSKLEDVDVSSKCEKLNSEAMSEDNLCRMYIGWLPFI